MKLCNSCDGYMPDRMFSTSGPNRLMSECKQCNTRRKMSTYVPRPRTNSNLTRDQNGRFRRAA